MPERVEPPAAGSKAAAFWTPEEMEAVHEVAAAIGRSLDLQQVIEMALDCALHALKLEMGWVRLFDEKGRLRVRVVRGLGPEQAERLMLLDTTQGVCAAALQKGDSVVIHGAPDDPAGVYPILRGHGMHSYLGMPLRLRSGHAGVLVVLSAKPYRFSAHQVELIRLIAGHVSMAIEHALLHDEIDGERRRREKELENINRELEQLNRLKDEFLSVVSHELKTPVTSMKLFSELVARRPEIVDDRMLDSLSRQAARLVSMINNLLDLSRLQLDRMTVNLQRIDLRELAREHCERYGKIMQERSFGCLTGKEEGPLAVNGDPLRLEQVLTNLLDNAVKFSPKGSHVTLEVSRSGAAARVAVRDEGIGIRPEHLGRLFELHYKRTPKTVGLGLGLYLSREIVERHGGRIWAESAGEGQGSTFYFELPLAQ